MTPSDHKLTPSKAQKTSSGPNTRRGRLPGPEVTFGDRLREARGTRKQADIADCAEVARSALARYEKGDRYPSVPELRRLCDALGVAPENLIYGDASPGFAPIKSLVAAVLPAGDSEKDTVVRLVLTGLILNALPRNEKDAFFELIWTAVSRNLRDKPKQLADLSAMCEALVENMLRDDDLSSLMDRKLKSDPRLREILAALPDSEKEDP